jgi:hypothetical protein
MVQMGGFEDTELGPWEVSGGAAVSFDKEFYYDGAQSL